MLPTQCALCRDWSGERICRSCIQRFAATAPRCQSCALRVPEGVSHCGHCIKNPPPLHRTLTAVDYAHPWDDLIAKFKFHSALDLAPALANRLTHVWEDSTGPRPTLLLPVPLSDARLRERGYNQAWEIARRVARRLRCAADAQLVLRIKDTPHQLAFPPERRAANVRGAFAVEPSRRGELQGREVTLVDDVMTTGATAFEIAQVLLQAGAAEVNLWILARTPVPGG